MNTKTVIGLVLVLGFALLALTLTTRQNQGPSPAPQTGDPAPTETHTPPDTFFDLPIEARRINDVMLIADERLPGVDLHISRASGRWRVQYPSDYPARTATIDRLLTLLIGLAPTPAKTDRRPDDNPPTIMLSGNFPYTRITLGPRLGGGKALLFVSSPGPADEDNRTEIPMQVDDALHDYIESFDAMAFYAKEIDAPSMIELERIEIVTPESKAVFVQRDERWFNTNGPTPQRTLITGLPGYPGIAEYFRLLDTIEVVEFEPRIARYRPEQYGLTNPLIAVKFYKPNPIPTHTQDGWQLNIGVPADPRDQTRYASFGDIRSDNPIVFRLPTPTALAFAQDEDSFRDPRVLTTPIALVKTIVLTSGLRDADEALATIDVDRMLLFDRPMSQPIALDPNAIATMLVTLRDTRAIDYVALNESDAMLKRVVTIVPKLGGDQETFEIRSDPLSDADEPTVLIRRSDESIALRVVRAAVTGLLDPTALV
ncbi:MAG: hypothetical protein ACPGYV_11085, partial [Phycisphaeraceae bacterium]